MKTEVEILLIIISYVIGSIPFGYIFTKRFVGLNILVHGSGNTGSPNVRHVAGLKVALITQVCDTMKGLIPVALIFFTEYKRMYSFDDIFIYAVGLSTILGHNFSIFLKFKGGVNTTLGASLILSPYSVFASVLVYFLVKWCSGYVSVGSICLAITFAMTGLIINNTSYLFYYLLVCTAFIILMHIPDLKRLMDGTENRWE
jgi:acyl phosphate:glycerol-3-phosphate acyltransferase